MASSAEIAQRIEGLLDSIFADVAYLPALAASWERMPEKERVVWDIEWSEQMRRLESLDRDYCAGVMTPEQRGRYGELLRKLKAGLLIIGQLDLELPSVSLDGEKAA